MAKHKYIETPEKLWLLFEQYKTWCKASPFKKTDWVGGMAMEVVREMERPLTFVGFEAWLYSEGIITNLASYEDKSVETNEEYLPIIMRVKQVIAHDQISGGMAGVYNSNLTARLNGLVEKTALTQNTITVEVKDE
jgi:hypothetical protein